MRVMGMLTRMAMVVSLLGLAVGCAQGVQPALPGSAEQPVEITATGQPAGPSPPQPAEIQDQNIAVRISDGKVGGVPAQVEVDRGARVRIEVTTDRRDELHVHGYEKTLPLTPDGPAALQFVADVPGVFEVETHDSRLLLFQLLVR